MAKRGLRSVYAKQKRAARKILLEQSYRDPEKAENINLLNHSAMTDELNRKFQHVIMSVVLQSDKGDVLVDSRGEGSLQK
jgi:hypothetical protein